MYSNFDYIKIDPRYYFSSKCVRLIFFWIIRNKIKTIKGVKRRF